MATTTGSQSVGTTATALTATSTPFSYGVWVRADAANSDNVYVGFADTVTANSAGSTDGYQLDAGQELLVSPAMMASAGLAADASLVYVIGGALSQKVFFLSY